MLPRLGPVFRYLVLASLVVAAFVVAPLPAPSAQEAIGPDPLFRDALWVGRTGDLLRLDTETGTLLDEAPGDARAVAVDELAGEVWIFGEGVLRSFGFDGSPRISTELSGLPEAPPHLQAHDEQVWLAVGEVLHRIDRTGALLDVLDLGEPSRGLALEPVSGVVRVATRTSVQTFDRDGLSLGAVDLGPGADLRDLDTVRGSDVFWVVAGDRALRLTGDGETEIEVSLRNPRFVAALEDGGAWVASTRDVVQLDPDGNQVVDGRPSARGAVGAVAAGADGSLWLATPQDVAQLDAAGSEVRKLSFPVKDFPGQTFDLAFYADRIAPELRFVSPEDGEEVTTRRPALELVFEDLGQGVDPSTLTLSTEGSALAVSCDASATGAVCTPEADLPDGSVTLTATVADFAGNVSAPAEVSFEVVVGNLPPELAPIGDQSIPLGGTLTLDLDATDPNGDLLTFGATPLPLPEGASLDGSSGLFRFAPTPDAVGTVELTFSVSDGLASDAEIVQITVLGPQPGAPTALAGRLLDTNDFVQGVETPIVGATVSLLGTGSSTTSGADGRFLLSGIPAGEQVLLIDSSTAVLAPDGSPYAGFGEQIVLIDGVTNTVDRPFFLPRIARESLTLVDPNQTTVVENSTLDVTMTVPPQTAKNPDGTNFTGELSVSEVPEGLAPASLPEELQPGLLLTIQPVGVNFATPAPLTFPNIDNLPPGSELDLWSLDADEGVFDIVGVGRVSSDGSVIETISGGIRSATWHSFLPPQPDPNGEDNNDDNQDPDKCDDCDTGSQTALRSGNLTVGHDLPTYLSLDQPRGVSLAYTSLSADPQPVLSSSTTVSVRAAVPDTLSASLEVGGTDQGFEAFTATTGLSESRDETVRQAVQFDAALLPTGAYPYRLRLFSNYGSTSIGSTQSGRVLVHNRVQSPLGAGWGIEGLERLHVQADGSVVQTDGNGAISRFTPISSVFSSDFEAGVGPEWSPANLDVTPTGRGFLGQFTNQTVNLSLDRLPEHTGVVVSFDLYVIRSWDGNSTRFGPDVWAVQARDASGNFTDLLRTTFSNASTGSQAFPDSFPGGSNPGKTGAEEDGTLGYDFRGTPRNTVYRLSFAFDHAADVLDLRFFGSGLQIVSDESWGLDNVDVELVGTAESTGVEFRSPAGDFTTLIQNEDGTFTRTFKEGTRVEYDAQGLQTALVDRNGNRTTYAYDAQGRLTRITDPVGLETVLAYTGGRLASITDPAGRITRFEHDAAGNLTRITDPDGTIRSFAYDARHRLVSQTSKRGFDTTYVYDDFGRNVTVLRPDGSTRAVQPAETFGLANPAAGIGTEPDPIPPVRPEEVEAVFIDGRGNATRVTADRFGARTRIVDPLGRVSTKERNIDGKVVRSQQPNGRVSVLTYDERGNVLTFRKGMGSSLEQLVQFEYEPAFNQITQITDPAGGISVFEHDGRGNPVRITDAEGGTREFVFNSRGLTIRRTDENGDILQFAYDVRGNLEEITDPLGRIVRLGRDAAGNVISITEAAGTAAERTTELTYDVMNRLTSATDPAGGTQLRRYDAEGRLVEQETPTGEVRSLIRDALGRVELQDDPAQGVREFSRDGNGNVVKSVDALGAEWTYEYDAANRLVRFVDPRTGEQVISYDVNDNPITFTDALGQATVFDYDLLDRRIRTINALGQTWGFSYDSRNNLITLVDPKGQTIRHRYDALSRLLETSTPDNDIAFSYDGVGNLLSVADRDSRVEFTYDGLDRLLTARTFDLGAQPAMTLTNRYDLNGNRVGLLESTGAETLFDYDAADRLTSLTGPSGAQAVLSHDASGKLRLLQFSNGVTGEHRYNGRGLLAGLSFTDAGGSSLTGFSYLHDPNGNLIEIAEGTRVRDFSYDVLERLISGGTSALPESYEYDAVGNRISSFLSQVHRHDSANRLLEDDQFTYGYDANGNRMSRTDKVTGDTTLYGYDALNQLTQVDLPDGAVVSYRYDGLGRRIEKNVDGEVTRYVYDEEDILLEFDGTNQLQARYGHGTGVDQPLLQERDGQAFFYLANHQGSIRALLDATGNAVNRYEYDAYGRISFVDETIANPYGFTGRESDAETGLHYYRARYYDPGTGKFLSDDPIRFAAGDPNLSRYVLSNPVNLVDPSGEVVPLVLAGAAIGAVVNVGITAASNAIAGRSVTEGLGSAALTGAISGGIGAFAGPAGGSLARTLGGKATGLLSKGLGAGISAAGSVGTELLNDVLEPCNNSSLEGAAISDLLTGALTSSLPIPVKGVSSLKQANFFAPRKPLSFFRTPNARRLTGSMVAGAAVGAGVSAGVTSLEQRVR